jgi:hypothetical protein
MDEFYKLSDSECYIPSSEPLRFMFLKKDYKLRIILLQRVSDFRLTTRRAKFVFKS